MCRKRSAGRALFLTACLQPHYGFRVFIIKHPGVEREGGRRPAFYTFHNFSPHCIHVGLYSPSCCTQSVVKRGKNSTEGSNFTHYKFFSDTEWPPPMSQDELGAKFEDTVRISPPAFIWTAQWNFILLYPSNMENKKRSASHPSISFLNTYQWWNKLPNWCQTNFSQVFMSVFVEIRIFPLIMLLLIPNRLNSPNSDVTGG